MSAIRDLTGQRFNRLTVLERAPSRRKPSGGLTVQWKCKCDCGNEIIVDGSNIKAGSTKSCGCLRVETNAKRHVTHGLTRTGLKRPREYILWANMKGRVTDGVRPYYAERGMHEPWLKFENFYADLLSEIGPHPGNGFTLDRIDNDRGYYPGNIRWATMKEQANNRRKRT